VDIFRGLAIILVVFAHVGRGLPPSVWTNFETSALDDWIYSFHMPAFFFAAGLFAGRTLRRGQGSFIAEKIRTVLYPYIVWSLIYIVAVWLVPGASHSHFSPAMFARIAYQPVGVYWFLYALFIIWMIYAILVSTSWGRVVFYVLCIVGWMVESSGVLEPALPHSTFWAWHAVLKYAIYVAFGDAVGALSPDDSIARGSLIFSLVFFAGLAFLIARGHHPEQPWWDLFLAIAGIQGLWELSVWLDRWGCGWLKYLGQHSLEIYVAHTFAAAAMRTMLLKADVTDMPVYMFCGTVAGIVLPLVLVWFTERVGGRWLYRW
jgi:fucose 4-O-acetylase-like acetyltransferase